MRELIKKIICVVMATFIVHAHSVSTEKKPVMSPKEEIEQLLNKTSHKKTKPGAKEIFVYNPNANKSKKIADIGNLPDEPSQAQLLEGDTEDVAIRPNFEDAELGNFINFVAQLTKINVIPTKDTQGAKVSLNMRTDLNKEQVWEVFLTVIEMAGFTINKSGNVFKVLRQDAKKTEPLPAYINVPAKSLPNSDQSIRFVTFLKNIQASDVEGLLKGMIGPGGDVLRQDIVNGFVITDKCHNIKAAMTIINELDDTGLREEVAVIPLKKNDAADVKKLLEEMTKNAGDKSNNAIVARLLGKTNESSEYFSATTKIIAEDRSNAIILLGNQKSIAKIKDFIATYIEREEPQVDSPIHRYQLEYSDAQSIKTILDDVVNSQTDSGVEKYGGVRMGGKYFKKMRFEVDKDSNSLLVSCLDKKDWKMLKETIRSLDKPQPQVILETLIVDIDLQDNKELGGQMRQPRTDQPFSNIGWQAASMAPVVLAGNSGSRTLAGDLGSILQSLTQGSAAFTLSKVSGGVWALFNIINENLNTSLVDNSFVTIANRVTASFSVGEARRLVSQVYSGYQGNSNSYETKPVNTTYTYTPQINADGLINLNIDISINEFVAGQTGGDTTNKSLKSTLACSDGQVLVLGGYAKTKVTEAFTNGFPILSEIPILGWLLKYKTRKISKTYTFFFICPTIVHPRETSGSSLYTKMKLHKARKDVADSVLTTATSDPIHNVFFNQAKENYFHKVDDFATARFQPSTVDLKHDEFYQPGITDKNKFDFKDEYEGNQIVRKMLEADTPSHKTKIVKEKSKENPKPYNTPAEKPESIITKITETMAKHPIPEQKINPTVDMSAMFPTFSTEKRSKLKELLSAPPLKNSIDITTDQPKGFEEQRSALKKLIEPQINNAHQENESRSSSLISQLPGRSDEIRKLVSDQQEKREKLKQTLTFGDRLSQPQEAPLTTHRKNLKSLLASYDSQRKPIIQAQIAPQHLTEQKGY